MKLLLKRSLSVFLSLLMVFSLFTIVSPVASAAVNPALTKGLQVVVSTSNVKAQVSNYLVDYIDPSTNNTYYLCVINNTGRSATITSISTSNLLSQYAANRVLANNDMAVYTINKSNVGADGNVIDFAVNYTLDDVYNETLTTKVALNQPMYIGVWNKGDDQKLPTTSDGNIPGFTQTNGNSAHRPDSFLQFGIDKGIMETGPNNVGKHADWAYDGFEYTLYIDATDLSAKTWQATGLGLRMKSWSSNDLYLQNTDKTTAGTYKLEGVSEGNSGSFAIGPSVNAPNTTNPIWEWAEARPIFENYANSVGNLQYATKAAGNSVSNGHSYNADHYRYTVWSGGWSIFPFMGYLAMGSKTSTQPAIIRLTEISVSSNANQHWNKFSGIFNCYVFDKMELRNAVRATSGINENAPISARYTTASWDNYKAQLRNAALALANMKTNQYTIEQAKNGYNNAVANRAYGKQLINISHNYHNGDMNAAVTDSISRVIVAPLSSYSVPYHTFSGSSNRRTAQSTETYNTTTAANILTKEYHYWSINTANVPNGVESLNAVINKNGGNWCWSDSYRNELNTLKNTLQGYADGVNTDAPQSQGEVDSAVNSVSALVSRQNNPKTDTTVFAHVAGNPNVTESSCSVNGHSIVNCQYCGYQLSDTVLPLAEHNYGAFVYDSNLQKHKKTCTACGDVVAENCNYDDEVTGATCNAGGSTKHTCTVCGHFYIDTYTSSLGHNYVDVENGVLTEPTCTDLGSKKQKCTRCQEERVVDIPALGHTYTMTTIAPTCNEQGYDSYVCSRGCGDAYENNSVPALGHDYTITGETVASTCTEQGYTVMNCSRCVAGTEGHSIKTNYTPVLEHVWVDTTVAVAATCTAGGTMNQECQLCHGTRTTPIAAKGHNFGAWVANDNNTHTKTCVECTNESGRTVTENCQYTSVYTEPTCSQQGYTTYTCSVCHNIRVITDTVSPLKAHTYEDTTVQTPAECLTDGVMNQKCKFCVATTTRVIPALGHDWGEVHVITPADCLNAGTMAATCSRCNINQNEVPIPALGHDKVIDVPGRAATCLVDGSTDAWHCQREGCGYSEASTVIPAPDSHDIVIDVYAKAATCVEAGRTQGSHCSRCDEVTVTSVSLPMISHNYVATVTAATCTTAGYTTHRCSMCFDSYVDSHTIALGHTYDETSDVVVTEGNCTEAKVIKHNCARGCGYSYNETITAPGHSWDEGVIVTPPTCDTEGTKNVTCTVCHFSTTIPVSKTNHNYIDTVVPPTCSDDGYTIHTCDRCSNSFSDTRVPAKGHTYIAGTVDPTCTAKGYTRYTCDDCGHSYKGDIVSELGHRYLITVVEADCVNKGYTSYKCTRCEHSYVGDYESALGHDYSVNVVAATCTEGGYTVKTCSRCADSFKSDFTEAFGHTFSLSETVPATNTRNGYKEYRCNCGSTYKEIIYKDGRALIYHTFLDDAGKPVTEAKLIVTNLDTNETRTLTTDLNGYFTEVLPEGEYELVVEKDGFERVYGSIVIVDGEVITFDMPVVPHRDCDCICHRTDVWARIYKLFMRLFKLFGKVVHCCDCSELYS